MVDFSYKLASAFPEDAVSAAPPPQQYKTAPPGNLTREYRSGPRSSHPAGFHPHDSPNRIGSASLLPQPVLRCKRRSQLPRDRTPERPGPTRRGPPTSPICPWPGDSSTWWPSWTGTAGTWWLGDCPTTLEAGFCADALTEALARGRPEVFNTDQGSQFTSLEFTQVLQDRGVKISMDGKGRYADNIFVERLWRTVKYEEVYLKAYVNAGEPRRELGAYFRFYNNQRPHQALGYRTPAEVFHGKKEVQEVGEESNDRRCSLGTGSVPLAGAPGLSLNSALILSN